MLKTVPVVGLSEEKSVNGAFQTRGAFRKQVKKIKLSEIWKKNIDTNELLVEMKLQSSPLHF